MANIQLPDKLQGLFEPHRYKVMYGGRGSSKSHSAAQALLMQGMMEPHRILCAREMQNSIADSVHKLLSDYIYQHGLTDFYEIQKASIKGQNGTEFFFAGLRHNVGSIKSFEGITRCWVEEAQYVTKSSWDVLVPTIRQEGSEIWVTFNPDLEEAETYQRFVKHPPADALVVFINWHDNPWFPEVLRQEMETLKERDYDAYLNVWEGHCRQALDGAIYANELRAATAENRITSVPYDASVPVHTYWDLGRRDCTSIWFVQYVGMQYRVIDFYQNQGEALGHYLKIVQEKPYVFGGHHLPHDAKNQVLHSDLNIEQQVRKIGATDVVPKVPVLDGINAARTIFNKCWFDADKCADGIHALRHYRYDVDPDTGSYSINPVHDEHSHAADAWRYFAVDSTRNSRTSRVDYRSLHNKLRRYQ